MPAYAGNVKLLLGTYSVGGDQCPNTCTPNDEGGTNLGFSFDYSFADSPHAGFIDYHLDTGDSSESTVILGYRWYHDNGFFVGGGLARSELGDDTGGATATSYALNLGYDYTFGNGFMVGTYFGYTWPRDVATSPAGYLDGFSLLNLSLSIGYNWQ